LVIGIYLFIGDWSLLGVWLLVIGYFLDKCALLVIGIYFIRYWSLFDYC